MEGDRFVSRPVTVLVLTPSIGGFYFGELLAGLGREVSGSGGRLVLVQTLDHGTRNNEASEPSDFATRVAWAEADGVVSITSAAGGPYLQQFRDAGKPVVLVSTRLLDFEAPVALPDNHGGTFAAVEHLIEHGHTRIGFVGNLGQADVRDRRAAYLDALAAHGIPADPGLLFPAPNNDWAGGVQAGHDVMASPDRPTALMVATDRNAIGLMRTLADAGLRVPHDVAVVGFDNIEAAAFSTPALSSVEQRFDDVGALAGRLLLGLLRGEEVAFTSHVLPASAIVRRASCGCGIDAVGAGVGRHEQWHDASVALGTLEKTISGLLLTGRRAADDSIRDTVRATVVEIGRLTGDADDTPAEGIRRLAISLGRLTTRPEVLRRITGAVLEHMQRDVTPVGSRRVAPAHGQLAVALWQLHAGAFLRQAEITQAALEEQYAVDAGLLDAGGADPRQLNWLATTHVRAGVLALWEGGQLRITGSYDPNGVLPDIVGTSTTPEDFPPAAFIGAAQPADLGACIVVPVASRDRDWGSLAIIGEIDTTSTLETYHNWATQLCARFEDDVLQEAVRESEQRYALAARATNDGLWEWNLRTGGVYMSERCYALLGLSPGADGDRDADRMTQWEALVHPDDLAEMHRAIRTVVAGDQETVNSEYRVRLADGSYRWLLARALGVPSPHGSVERVVGSLSDIHERRSLEDQLRKNALYDTLTGLPNRRLFLSRLDHALKLWQRDKTPFAVIFLDLDGFKAVNDSLGHQMGDRVLNAVGARIAGELRAVDIAARFGGDEFAILLHGVEPDDVLGVAERIQLSLAEVINLDSQDFVIGASLGITTSNVDYASAEDILRDADTAMYHAKEANRGTVSFFDTAMHTNALNKLRAGANLRRALDENQFEMHYQPIVDLTTGRADRFEALVRWRNPEYGLELPGAFLPAMAETGLIVQLGRWVIDEVCRQLAAWGPSVADVAVNLSDREFWHTGLLPHVMHSLNRHNLTADRLTLEITEGVIMRRPEAAKRLMRDMHDAGLTLHVDDFGTGYSSLQMLHHFPVDAFKIDRSFIETLTSGDHTDELVRAIVAMGKALGLTVVAEGIETTEQFELLRQIGCENGQGFLFAPAVPADHVSELLGRTLGTGQHNPARAAPAR